MLWQRISGYLLKINTLAVFRPFIYMAEKINNGDKML
jgi:hypothetical protein